jgi:hypothetical protein
MRARGLESPDRADAIIGAIMLGIGARGDGPIGERELAGIRFGGGVRLFSGEPVSLFEELRVWKACRMLAGCSHIHLFKEYDYG